MATQTRPPTSEVAVTGTWSGTSRHLLLDDYPDPVADGGTPTDKTTCSAAGVLVMGFSAFSIPAGSSAISVQVMYKDSKNGTQSCTIGAAIRCNDTTNRLSGTHNPANASFTSRSDNYATNPKSAAAWTVNDVNGVGTNGLTAFGLSVTDASPTIDVGSAQIQVTYTPPVTGDLAVTEGATDAAASTGGTVEWIATMAATDAVDAAAASGGIVGAGDLAVTEAATDTAAMSGDVSSAGFSGDLDATETADSVAASGLAEWRATFAATEAADAASVAGNVAWRATLAVTESSDICASDAAVAWVATLAATDAPDALASAGTARWLATFAATEAQDTAASSGVAQWLATMAAQESADTAAASGGIVGSGSMAVVEAAADHFFATDAGVTVGSLEATEAADSAAGAGVVEWTVTMAATEAADSFAATGLGSCFGNLATSEVSDGAAAAGTVQWAAALAAVEGADVFAAEGLTPCVGALAATEAQDTTLFLGGGVTSKVFVTSFQVGLMTTIAVQTELATAQDIEFEPVTLEDVLVERAP